MARPSCRAMLWPAYCSARCATTANGRCRPTGGSSGDDSQWAFARLLRANVPGVPTGEGARPTHAHVGPIDCFVLAELHRHGMTPNEPADKPTLLRRATFDLIGLPPTPEEV